MPNYYRPSSPQSSPPSSKRKNYISPKNYSLIPGSGDKLLSPRKSTSPVSHDVVKDLASPRRFVGKTRATISPPSSPSPSSPRRRLPLSPKPTSPKREEGGRRRLSSPKSSPKPTSPRSEGSSPRKSPSSPRKSPSSLRKSPRSPKREIPVSIPQLKAMKRSPPSSWKGSVPMKDNDLPEKERKWCSCVLKVGSKNSPRCNMERSWGTKDCKNPYAICSKSVGTSSRRCGQHYDYKEMPTDLLETYAELSRVRTCVESDRQSLLRSLEEWKRSEGKM